MATTMNQERPVLYINISVHDACEAVKDEVAAKVKKYARGIPKPLQESVANRAASRVTWDLTTASKVVDKMGPKLCQDIPNKTKKKGIQVHVESVYSEGNYLVLELQVQHVDAVVVTDMGKVIQNESSSTSDSTSSAGNNNEEGETFASFWVHGMFNVIGVKNRDSLERDLLPTIVQRKISVSIREMIEEKLVEKKMAADVDILQEDKQARFFFERLRQVRAAIAAAAAEDRARRLSAASVATSVKEGAVSAVGQAASVASSIKLVRPASDPTVSSTSPPPPPPNITPAPVNNPLPLFRSSTEKPRRGSLSTSLHTSLSTVTEVSSVGGATEKAVKSSTNESAKDMEPANDDGDDDSVAQSSTTRTKRSFSRSLSNVVVEAASAAKTTIKKARTANSDNNKSSTDESTTSDTADSSSRCLPDNLCTAVEAAAAAAELNKVSKGKSSASTTDSAESRKGSSSTVTSVAETIKRGTVSSASSVASTIRKSPKKVVKALRKASFSSSQTDSSTNNTESLPTIGEASASLYDSLSAAAAATFSKQQEGSDADTDCASKLPFKKQFFANSAGSVSSMAATIKRGSVSSAASVATTVKKGPKALAKVMKKTSSSSSTSSLGSQQQGKSSNSSKSPLSVKGSGGGDDSTAETIPNTDSSTLTREGSLCDSLSSVVEQAAAAAAAATFPKQQLNEDSATVSGADGAPPSSSTSATSLSKSVAATIKKGSISSSAAIGSVASTIKRGSVSSAASVATTVKRGPKALVKKTKSSFSSLQPHSGSSNSGGSGKDEIKGGTYW